MKGFTRRKFILNGIGMGFTGSLLASSRDSLAKSLSGEQKTGSMPFIRNGEKQIFADDVMIFYKSGVERKCHVAQKPDHPVLKSDKPWEFVENEGVKTPYAGIYGSVLRDESSGSFRMWYNVYKETCYAESPDGINWQKPDLGLMGQTNKINLFDFQSPSFILDKTEPDPAKRYKAVGAKDGFGKEVINRLKSKFRFSESYHRNYAYCAAYSADGLNWTMYPDPVLMGMDTITLAQDPVTGEYLAFHKQTQDPRSFGRQVFLSTSKDMLSWSNTELAMATDEIDHEQARKLEGGTHAELYNMSAFPYSGQWLGLITHFRCIGEPLVNGKAKAGQKGIIDVQLVHSRDGRKWQRCSDRSPVIPTGPYEYDKGMVFGVCNTPVFVGDEMWMYYSASTDIHCGTSPDKKVSVGRAAWRIDGMVSLQAEEEGIIQTACFRKQGDHLFVNADVRKGQLVVEILNEAREVIPGYGKNECVPLRGDGVRQPVTWNHRKNLPEGSVSLKFYLTKGNLYSYIIN
jgi:hypothetical protein